MRPLIVVAAAVVALTAVAIARLGQTLGQLGTIEAPSAPAALATGAQTRTPDIPSDAAQARREEQEEEATVAASGGDEHIMQALAQDPDFMRAAEELLQDPDAQTREEARQLLRELGAAPLQSPKLQSTAK